MAVGDVYEGRLVTDGNGNLLAGEGDSEGHPVAYFADSDDFRFIGWDEPSHNQRHGVNQAEMVPTQDVDPELPGYAGTADSPNEGHEHHFGVLDSDPHYDPDTDNNTRIRNLPDSVSAKASSHTNVRGEPND